MGGAVDAFSSAVERTPSRLERAVDELGKRLDSTQLDELDVYFAERGWTFTTVSDDEISSSSRSATSTPRSHGSLEEFEKARKERVPATAASVKDGRKKDIKDDQPVSPIENAALIRTCEPADMPGDKSSPPISPILEDANPTRDLRAPSDAISPTTLSACYIPSKTDLRNEFLNPWRDDLDSFDEIGTHSARLDQLPSHNSSLSTLSTASGRSSLAAPVASHHTVYRLPEVEGMPFDPRSEAQCFAEARSWPGAEMSRSCSAISDAMSPKACQAASDLYTQARLLSPDMVQKELVQVDLSPRRSSGAVGAKIGAAGGEEAKFLGKVEE